MKQAKDLKKKKGTSADNANTDKLSEKRRSSLTGSVMDTSSSSTSSVDSDELEQFDRSSKGTMTTSDVSKQTESSSNTNVSDNDAILTALGTFKNDGFKNLGNETVDQSNRYNFPSNSIQRSGAAKVDENRRHTKKQTRRERRKKEKEKKNGESYENTVKANCEKSSALVQSLLNLRLAENAEFAQKRPPLNPVAVSFGDFPERSNNYSFEPVEDPRTDKGIDVVEDNDVFHVYTTGNKLRELLTCDENEGAISKFHVSVDDKVRYGLMGPLPGGGGGGYSSARNAEMDSLLRAESTVKMEQKYSQWTKTFHTALVEGNQDVFLKKFNCLMKILKKAPMEAKHQLLDEQHCKERLMKGIISHFSDQQGSYTVIHQLAATRSVEKKCGTCNIHNKCKMIKLVLGMLSWRDRRDILRLQTQKSGKTALHLAVMTGQDCQLEALMSFGAPVDVPDCIQRAPIHYAVLRNDVYIMKMLLWYGADISLNERNYTPLQLASIGSNTTNIANFLYSRKEALEKFFLDWATMFVRGVWTPQRSFTDLHFVKLSRGGNSELFGSENKKRTVAFNIQRSVKPIAENKKHPIPLLFVLPTFYKFADVNADANDPQIYCTTLTSDGAEDIAKLIQDSPILNGLSTGPIPLDSALVNPHNGYFYVYQLPRDLPTGNYTISFNVDISQMKEKARFVNLAVQGLACGPPDFCIWDTAKEKGKSKVE